MKLLSNKILLLIFLFVFVCQAQRGGGSRSSSSRSRSSRSSRSGSGFFGSRRGTKRRGSGSFFGWFSDQKDNSTANQTLDGSETQSQQGDGSGVYWAAGILGAFGFLGYIGYQQDKKNQVVRLTRIQQQFTSFEGQKQSNPCNLDDRKMADLKNWFQSNRWTIYFRTNDKTFQDSALLNISDFKERGRYSYNFKMSMTDSVGASDCRGILVHTNNYFSIQFQKTYRNRSQAGQTGSFDLLLYKGVQQGQNFRGQWYYSGYSNDNRYSGTWEMNHA